MYLDGNISALLAEIVCLRICLWCFRPCEEISFEEIYLYVWGFFLYLWRNMLVLVRKYFHSWAFWGFEPRLFVSGSASGVSGLVRKCPQGTTPRILSFLFISCLPFYSIQCKQHSKTNKSSGITERSPPFWKPSFFCQIIWKIKIFSKSKLVFFDDYILFFIYINYCFFV